MEPTEQGHFSVLVVEDEPDHAALLQAAFSYRFFPCTVHVTASSEEAIDYLLGTWPFVDRERHPLPDIIILDLGLPGMGGLDFLSWLSGRAEPWSGAPVVIFSATADEEIRRRAFAVGARDYVVKPADFNELVYAVEEVLRRWRPGGEAAG